MPPIPFRATGKDGSDLTEELLTFAENIGLEATAPGRYSVLLLLELFGAAGLRQLDPSRVVREIASLEGNATTSLLKPPTVFKHAPLKGLWHKHYLESGLPAFARNLRKGLGRFGMPYLESRVEQAAQSGEERYLTDEDISRIAHDAVVGNWERLTETSALTGEWIVFAKWQDKNYYLCLGAHESGDETLRSQIDNVCLAEFPFLRDLLSQP